MLILYIALTLACIFIVKRVYGFLQYRNEFNQLPGHKDTKLMYGNFHDFPDFKEKALSWFFEHCQKYKYFERLWVGPLTCLLMAYHPETVKEVIRVSIKPRNIGTIMSTSYDMGVSWLGEGLVLSNGPRWLRNRRLLTKSFHFDILKRYMKVYNSCSDVLCKQIREFAKSGKSFDLDSLLSKYALDIILRCAFSMESNCQVDKHLPEYVTAIDELQDLWMDRCINPLYSVDFIFKLTAKGRRFHHLCDIAHRETESLIKQRQADLFTKWFTNSQRKDRDFLDTLLTAKDEQGKVLKFEEIRNEVDTFLFTGHDTTASGTMWTLISLAKHPEYQQQVYKEVKEVLRSKKVSWEDLSKLQFTTQCIKEALRHHSTVPQVQRVTTEDIVLNGHKIKSGTHVILQYWCLHHNPHVWDEPMKYDPDRFSPENVVKMDPYQFLPFSAGPRNCIGQSFAMNQMKVTVARIIKKFVLTLDPKRKVKHHIKLTLKSDGGAFVFASMR